MNENNTFQSALGMGEDFPLPSGGTVKVYPAHLADLEEVMPLWKTFSSTSIQGCYMPGKEKERAAFEDLLLLASGQGDLRKDENQRKQAVKSVLEQLGDVSDTGAAVYRYIQRFLGFVERDTTAAPEGEGK